MDARSNSKLFVPMWVLVSAAAAFVLILGAILWSFNAGGSRTNKVDVGGSSPAALGSGPRWSPMPRQVLPPLPGGSPYLPDQSPAVVRVLPADPQPPPAPPKRSTAKVVVRREAKPVPLSPTSGMFPMGNVLRSLPEVRHPFRQIAELFPSFEYDGRVWAFTGQYAYEGQVDLAPVGVKLNDRDVLALANTQGPGSALFVQSAHNRVKYAIYR